MKVPRKGGLDAGLALLPRFSSRMVSTPGKGTCCDSVPGEGSILRDGSQVPISHWGRSATLALGVDPKEDDANRASPQARVLVFRRVLS